MDELAALVRLHSVHAGEDGSQRLLLQLADGQSVESVLLPRDGLCVSTQVGCAVGCVFCMTGRGGLARQLGSAEIVAQVALARARRSVTKVVFMGMGEPAHNLDAVLEAIDLLGTAGGIGHKNLVFSTVGDRACSSGCRSGASSRRWRCRCIRRRPNAARACCRARRASRPTSWCSAARPMRAPPATRCRCSGRCCAASTTATTRSTRWCDLLAGRHAVLNLIPYNRVDGLDFARPEAERAAEMARTLHRRGVLTKLRRSAGQDVQAGCGQLRARVVPLQAVPA